MSLSSLRSLAVIGLMTVSAFASAQTTYTDQATFLANVQPGSYLETFDSLVQGDVVASPINFAGNGFTYTASAVGNFFNVGPAGDTWLSTNFGSTDIVFTFTSGNVTAVGGEFFTTNFDGDESLGSITATLNSGSTITINPSSATTFGGFTTPSAITSLTISVPANFASVNNLIVGTAVPAPSSAIVLIAGFGLMGIRTLALRRKR